MSLSRQCGALRHTGAVRYTSSVRINFTRAHVRLFPSRATGVRTVDSLYKLKIFIQIAMLYLEDDDPVSAETFIKKASSLIAGAKDPELELQYKTSYARIMDAKRRWEGGGHCCSRRGGLQHGGS